MSYESFGVPELQSLRTLQPGAPIFLQANNSAAIWLITPVTLQLYNSVTLQLWYSITPQLPDEPYTNSFN